MELSKRVRGISPSATLAISAKAKEMKKAGVHVIDLGVGEPDYDTPDNIKKAAKEAINEGYTKYTQTAGLPELREVIADKFRRENNIPYEASQIIVSNGAKHSLMNICLTLLEEGDEVILIKPFWLSYEEQIKLCGATPIFAETENLSVKASLIAEKISNKTKMLIINSPCNPSGKIIEREELEIMADLCVQHDIICVSDEPYEHIIFNGKEHLSIASLGREIYDRTITVNAVSKTYAMTGWRIGYCAGPQNIITAMSNLQSHSTSGPCSIAQHAAIEALRGDQQSIEEMRRSYQQRRDYVVKRLNSIKRISCVEPEGTFYVFPNISKIGLSSVTFCEQLLVIEQVAIVPGRAFGDDESVRISFATNMENLIQGLDKLERFCNNVGDNHEW